MKKRTMSKQKKAYLRGKLLERRRQLLSMMEQKVRQQRERNPIAHGDEFDIVNDTNDTEMGFMVASIESASVAEIENALERIEEGTYGQCASCGEKIPEARMKAMPFATLCVKCKEHEERTGMRNSYRAGVSGTIGSGAGWSDDYDADAPRVGESIELAESFADSDND